MPLRPPKLAKGLTRAALAAAALASAAAAPEPPPNWAFGIEAPPAGPNAPALPSHLPGSTRTFRQDQLEDMFAAPDWYPNEHPVPPPLVAQGAKPNLFACGYCHLPNGAGRPENASLAGLKPDYILRQVQAFATGTRASANISHAPTNYMIAVAAAAAANPALPAAAAYFAGLTLAPKIHVVEAETIPRMTIDHRVYRPNPAGGSEPLGARIVETPDDFSHFEMRDAHTSYTAYVPPGSLARGAALMNGALTPPCTLCHGTALRGGVIAPPLAGRSPSYLARQLAAFRAGTRYGGNAAQMTSIAAKLNDDSIIALSAYLAGQPP